MYETFGEDPKLVAAMASSMIDGIQEIDNSSVPSRAAACAKHFIGYSAPRTGHDRSPAWVPTRHLYQYFVPPWKNPKYMTVMESYSETDGVPMVANRQTTKYLLRQQLGFTGVLVTDYEEIRNLHNWHHVSKSDDEAVIHSLSEGSVDMSMIPWDANGFTKAVSTAVQNNRLPRSRVEESAGRVLQLKKDLRMFDEQITIVDPNLDLVGTDRDAVLPIVQDSIVLTENKGSALPLDPNSPLRVHVTGPTANSLRSQAGGWTGQWQGAADSWFTYGDTVWDSIQSISAWTTSYSCGVDILGKECEDPDEKHVDENLIDQFKHWAGLTPTTSMAKTLQDAKDADVTIVCVGEEPNTEKPGDIRSLSLPAGQNDLIHALHRNTETKIVLVYFGGRPRLLPAVDEVDAVIIGFLPGPDGGSAVTDVITGRVNPSGRLPLTYPLFDDGGGVPYFHSVTDQCTEDTGDVLPHYNYVPCDVQWPFGHGMSYTSFDFTDFTAQGGIDDDLNMTVTILNSGSRAGAIPVMFFTFDESRLVTPEYKRLRAFRKVFLEAGSKATISVTVPVDELKFIGPHDDHHAILDPDMVSYVGVGHKTDCRLRDDKNNPDENQLCVKLQRKGPQTPYVPSCEAACDVWTSTACSSEFGLSTDSCRNLCMSTGADGWGWNYVHCIESVAWGLSRQEKSSSPCWKLRSICRDILQTGPLNEYGDGLISGPVPGNACINGPPGLGQTSSWLAVLVAVVTSTLMMLLIRGRFSSPKAPRCVVEEERYGGIQLEMT